MVNGILTPSDIPPAPRSSISAVSHKKSESIRQNHINWQTILKDATFHTLIKHTGFTPSLDEKIETDRLLWEKIQAARFLKKQGKIDDFEKVRTGVLVDTTRERGYLEFRQSDRSVYNCEQSRCKPILDRLLAIWRVQQFESSNSIWIRVKLPRYQLFEDLYEYTPLQGLKQISVDNSQHGNVNNQNKHNSWKNPDTDSEKLEQNEKLPISRIDSKYFNLNDGIKNMYKKPSVSVYKPQTPTYTILGTNPRQSYVPYVLGLPIESLPRPEVKNAQWNQRGTYYQIEPITLISEFRKNEKVYDGFIPSAGPTGSPSVAPVYQPTIPKPVMEHYSPYIPPRLPNPSYYYTSTTPKNFKPSTEFVRYSEPDPFYLDNSYAYTTPRTNELSDIKQQGSIQHYQQYPTSINSQLLTYDKERNITDIVTTSSTDKNIMTTIATKTEPTSKITNILVTTEGEGQIVLPTNSITNIRPTAALTLSTTNNKVQIKNEEKKTGSILSSETYDGYAPLFIKWGDKIKPSQNRSSTNGRIKIKNVQHESLKRINDKTTTEEPTTIRVSEKIEISPDNDKNILTTEDEMKARLEDERITTEDNEESSTIIDNTTKHQFTNLEDIAINENNSETYTEQSENTTTLQLSDTTENELTPISEDFNTTKDILNDWPQQTTSVIGTHLLPKNDATTFPIDSGTTNLVIDIEDKSPEEVVNELTTIGVKNSSRVEGYSGISETILNKYSFINSTIENNLNRTKNIRDQEAEQTDPTSVIVNRISTSYSYKTAKGKIRNLKPFVKDS